MISTLYVREIKMSRVIVVYVGVKGLTPKKLEKRVNELKKSFENISRDPDNQIVYVNVYENLNVEVVTLP